ncbi:hypothetical protein [Cystobacter fuscus]|uniref:hypothetical protein n=1 Tax=Cystobacter fuscus TaxID=43 RepID=UPI002B31694C|nr:hypothetical protein F0U63_21010 [Cystobacter fuscus]
MSPLSRNTSRALALLSTLLVASAFAAPAKDQTHASRYMPPGDPNLDPNWDWTGSGPGHTMYYSVNGSTPLRLDNVQLPFYTAGHPLSTDQKDMYKQDGWVLAYRDFGTPTDAPAMPFFALYNKYRGTLRVMFYNAPNVAYSFYRVDLAFRSTSATGALLTFSDSQKATTGDYDKAKRDSFMGRIAQFRGWAYADFTVFGYDPNLHPDSKFRLEIWGIDEGQIQLNSTQFTLSEVVTDANPSASGNGGANLMDAFNKGQKFYNNVGSVKKSLQDVVTKTPGNPWWKQTVQSVLGSSIATVAPYIGGLIGFVSSFIGGKSKPAPREPLNFQGSLQMSGTISTTRQIFATDLALVQGPTAPDFYRPLNPITWGLFNLTQKPLLRALVYRDECIDDYGMLRYCEQDYGFALGNLQYVFNPNAGVTLKSIKAAFTYSSGPSSFVAPADLGGSYYYRADYCNNNQLCWESRYGDWPQAVGLELVLQVNSPTLHSDSEIVVYKVFSSLDYSYEYQ